MGVTRDRLTQRLAFFNQVPVSGARASGSNAGAAIDASLFDKLVGILHIGVLTSTGTINLRFQHNSNSVSSHSAWADISSASCVTSTFGSANNGEVALLELNLNQHPEVSRYVRALTTGATNSWLGGAHVLGADALYDPASDENDSDVAQTVVF